MQDGEGEDAGRHEVGRILGDAIGQRLQQAVWRRRWIVGQRRREMRGTRGTGHPPNIAEPGACHKATSERRARVRRVIRSGRPSNPGARVSCCIPRLPRVRPPRTAWSRRALPRRSAIVLALALVLPALLIPASPVHAQAAAPGGPPLRIAIAGLVHGHVRGHMNAMVKRTDVELVGVYEQRRGAAREVRRDTQDRRGEDVCRPGPADHDGQARGARRLHQHVRSPEGHRDGRQAWRARDGREAAGGVDGACQGDRRPPPRAARSTCWSTTRRPGTAAIARSGG